MYNILTSCRCVTPRGTAAVVQLLTPYNIVLNYTKSHECVVRTTVWCRVLPRKANAGIGSTEILYLRSLYNCGVPRLYYYITVHA